MQQQTSISLKSLVYLLKVSQEGWKGADPSVKARGNGLEGPLQRQQSDKCALSLSQENTL